MMSPCLYNEYMNLTVEEVTRTTQQKWAKKTTNESTGGGQQVCTFSQLLYENCII